MDKYDILTFLLISLLVVTAFVLGFMAKVEGIYEQGWTDAFVMLSKVLEGYNDTAHIMMKEIEYLNNSKVMV